jgi:hypothetical protein
MIRKTAGYAGACHRAARTRWAPIRRTRQAGEASQAIDPYGDKSETMTFNYCCFAIEATWRRCLRSRPPNCRDRPISAWKGRDFEAANAAG